MPQGKWFRIGYGIVLMLLIAYLASKVNFLFDPIGKVLAALFVPIVLAGIFYYTLRPLVRLLAKWLPLTPAILLVFLIVIGLIYLMFRLIWPPIREQSLLLVNNFPEIVDAVREWLVTFQQHEWVRNISSDETFTTEKLTSGMTDMLGGLLNSIIGSLNYLLDTIMNFFLLLGLVPFIIYYFLKEGDKFPRLVLRLIPPRMQGDASQALKEIDASIGSFILSKVITSLLIGMLTFVGYAIIDLPYPLLLGLVAAITNIVPYLGPLLAAVPTVIVALTVSPLAVLQVCVILVIANQIESNLIGPKIMSRQMNVHPLTIMLLVIGAGAILGPAGMIIVVPLYCIGKIISTRIYAYFNNNRIHKEPNILPPKS